MTSVSGALEVLVRELSGWVDNVVAFDSIDSTHRAAIRILEQMDEENVPLATTAVVALRQSRGMGRVGRRWESPEGGLYLDWLRSGVAPEIVPQLPMLAAAAAHLAVSRLGVEGLHIKWPNDLLVGGRKLGGVLVQVRHGERISVAVGLGVNVTATPALDPDDRPAQPPVAVSDLIPGPDADDAFQGWSARLAGSFVEALGAAIADPAPAVARWRQAVVHRPGDAMTVRLGSGDELEGRFVGLSPDGFLRLELPGGERTITGGDVL